MNIISHFRIKKVNIMKVINILVYTIGTIIQTLLLFLLLIIAFFFYIPVTILEYQSQIQEGKIPMEISYFEFFCYYGKDSASFLIDIVKDSWIVLLKYFRK